MPSLGTVDALQPIAAAPPNLREEMCGKHRKRPAAEEEDDESRRQSAATPARAYAMTLPNLRDRQAQRPLLGPLDDLMPPSRSAGDRRAEGAGRRPRRGAGAA